MAKTNEVPTTTNGKIILIDPNKVNDGIGGSLKPEDLFIYVNLEVDKKPRTIIAVDNNNDSVINNNDNGGHITFIKGTDQPDGTNALSTNYTRLTTVLTDDNNQPNSESFGIKDIHIDFNSAFAPEITISFIDVRGSTLFEPGNQSKYNMFFNLPYPIFKLHVKGFYGPTVSYCLHLLKFNSKFNSETGNFEITCKFIGYTFAFLSDMLLGYMRAVTEIPRGRQIFQEYKNKNPELITINNLIRTLNDADRKLGKLAANNRTNQALETIHTILDSYKDYNKLLEEFKYELSEKLVFIGSSQDKTNNKIKDSYLYSYEANIDLELSQLKNKYFHKLNDTAKEINKKIVDQQLKIPTDVKDYIQFFRPFNIEKYENDNVSLSENQKNRFESIDIKNHQKNIFLIDFKKIYDNINTKKNLLIGRKTELSDKMADKMRETIKDLIGFNPTIQNFVEIFTVHAEVFLKLIRETSHKAAGDEARTNELKRLTSNSLNISSKDINIENYYPWPEYNVGGVEKWIGNDIAPIPETILVEEFLNALLVNNNIDDIQSDLLNSKGGINHNPSNAFDLPIYKTTNPYTDLTFQSSFVNNPLKQIWLELTIRMFNYAHCNHGIYNGFKPARHDTYTLFGKCEAVALIKSLEDNDYDKKILNELKSYQGGDVQDQINDIINLMTRGDEKYKLPNNQQNIMEYDPQKKVYRYVYLSDLSSDDPNKNRVYLPSSANLRLFRKFYDDSNMLTYSKLKEEFKGNNFIYTGFGKKYIDNKLYERVVDDGSTYYDLKDEDEFFETYSFMGYGDFEIEPEYDKLSLLDNINTPESSQNIFDPTTNNNVPVQDNSNVSGVGVNDEILEELNDDDTEIADNSQTTNEGYVSFEMPPVKFPKISKPHLQTTKYTYDNTQYCYINNTKLQVNDMTNVMLLKEGGNFGLNSMIPSSLFFYKDLIGFNNDKQYLFNNPWYGMVNTGIVDSISEPNYFITKKHNLASADPDTISNINFNNNDSEPLLVSDDINFFLPICKTELFIPAIYGDGVRPNKNIFDLSEPNKGNISCSDISSGKYEHFGKINEISKETIIDMFRGFDKCSENLGYNRKHINDIMFGNLTNDKKITSPTAFTFGKNKVQLFGSELYFEQGRNETYQDTLRARAFLFLRMTPLMGNFKEIDGGFLERLVNGTEGLTNLNGNNARDNMLLNPGLQRVPWIWILALGAEYWRRSNEENGEVFFKDQNGFSVIAGLEETPNVNSEWLASSDGKVMKEVPFDPIDNGFIDGFDDINYSIEQIPKQFKNLCLNEFKKWTKQNNYTSNSWNNIRKRFEIIDFDLITDFDSAKNEWINKWENFKYNRNYLNENYNLKTSNNEYKYSVFQPYFENSEDLIKIKAENGGSLTEGLFSDNTYVYKDRPKYRYDYICVVNYRNEDVNDVYIELLAKTKMLVKRVGLSKLYYQSPIIFKKETEEFYRGFFTELNAQLKNRDELFETNKEKNKKNVFGSVDNDDIRLTIYQHLSNIYNKWIGGTENNSFVSCISEKDIKNNKYNLIDRFKFIDRSYDDIGDKLIINPLNLLRHLTYNQNESFYNFLGHKILANNNLDFIALPTFIDFRDTENVKSMFETHTYNDDGGLSNISGPTFVCMYVGQTSQHLDLDGGGFINDGVDFSENCSGKITNDLPSDFNINDKNADNIIPVFAVNYGDQNQSIFKDVNLDQSEFSETQESLEVIDNLTREMKSFVGQNLHTVYSIRSYTAEVEAMGNLAIQPYMYFQLNGIPMFHGGYMIIKVTHTISSHYIKTKFKGVRIRRIKTPLIEADTVYLNILNAYNPDSFESVSVYEGGLDHIDYNTRNSSNDSNNLKDKTGDNVNIHNKQLNEFGGEDWLISGLRFIETQDIRDLNAGNPLNDNYKISTGPGFRRYGSAGYVMEDGTASTKGPHNGIDFNTPVGTEILAIADGSIESIRVLDGAGLYITTKHIINNKTIKCLYMHLSGIDNDIMNETGIAQLTTSLNEWPNLEIKKGQVLGRTGGNPSSPYGGTTTGPHLHFEMRLYGDNTSRNNRLDKYVSNGPNIIKSNPTQDINNGYVILNPFNLIKDIR